MDALTRIAECGILPVISLSKIDDALPLATALTAGGISALEVTLRTGCALDAIHSISASCPDLAVGAGTVLTCEQADAAMAAGASFLVTPGYLPALVEYCAGRNYPIVPGCTSASDIAAAAAQGCRVVKYFPSEPLGGIAAIKLLSGPFPQIKFVPTGGMTMDNISSYLREDCIAACGGSFMAKSKDIEAGNFAFITEQCKKAMDISLGFELAHVGVNNENAQEANLLAARMAGLFRLPVKAGHSSTFAGKAVEYMYKPYFGAKGHIGFYTNSVSRALAYFKNQGIEIREESIRRDEKGKLVSFYLKEEIGGFAVHVVRRS